MSKNNENDIEKIFQKAAEEYSESFEEKDWQAMRGMLDKEKEGAAVVQNGKSKRIFLSLILLFLFSGAVYLWTTASNPETGNEENSLTSHQFDPEKYKEDIEKEKGILDSLHNLAINATSTENAGISLLAVPKTKEDNRGEKPHLKAEAIAIDGSKDSNKLQKEDALSDFENSDSQKKTPGDKQQKAEYTHREARKEKKATSENNEAKKSGLDDSEGKVEAIIADKKAKNKKEQIATIDSLKEDTVSDTLGPIAELDSISNQEDEEQDAATFMRMSVSPTVGPDLSKMGLNKFTSPGYSYGLFIHYALSSRWSIGVGALKSTKKYLGSGSEYSPPKGYWKYATNGVVPKEVAGECALLEIPVEVQYNAFSNKKINAFIAVGASSYFISSESYRYSFKEPNPDASVEWSSDNSDGKYFFNIINLSLGVERSISPSFKLGLVPYIKIPLKGMGWSEAKFLSIGTYVTLRYGLIKSNNKK